MRQMLVSRWYTGRVFQYLVEINFLKHFMLINNEKNEWDESYVRNECMNVNCFSTSTKYTAAVICVLYC